MRNYTLEQLLRRDRAIVIGALALLTVLAWAYTIRLASSMTMGGMDGSPAADVGAMLAPAFKSWTVADFAYMFVMWSVMMVGMMVPSVAPMVLIYARVGRQAALQGKPLAATGFFAGGYLLAWTAFSLVATIGQWLLERVALLTPMMAAASGVLGALVLIGAGVFQWTPSKNNCLKSCQAPLSFIQKHGGFRRDPWGSVTLGVRHGMFCVGCCWALMALLFVGGVMNIVWVAGLTIFVLLEKAVPLGGFVPRVSGTSLVLWGMWSLSAALR